MQELMIPAMLATDAVTYGTCHHGDSSLRDNVRMPHIILMTHTQTQTDQQTHRRTQTWKRDINLLMQHINPGRKCA